MELITIEELVAMEEKITDGIAEGIEDPEITTDTIETLCSNRVQIQMTIAICQRLDLLLEQGDKNVAVINALEMRISR